MGDTSTLLSSDRQALDKFVGGNLDLVQLETIARRFNIFESLGVVKNERKHSNFLRFLLDPRESHGLSDRFLKRFIQTAILDELSVAQLTQSDIDVLDLSQASVVVERDWIDILISDRTNNLYVIIENKVGSLQHSDQLARYHKLLTKLHPSDKILGIFLTRDGELPEHDKYVTLSYSSVRGLIDETLKRPDVNLDQDVRFALTQYAEVLGRHFMADDGVKALCAKIYKQHKQAIDLIIEHLPDQRDDIAKRLGTLIGGRPGLARADGGIAYVRFFSEMMKLPYFSEDSEWTKSKKIMLFQFRNTPNSLELELVLGPGGAEKRQRIFEVAHKSGEPFSPGDTLSKWTHLYKRIFLNSTDYKLPIEEIMTKIDSNWEAFLAHDLPRIEERLLKEDWTVVAEGSRF